MEDNHQQLLAQIGTMYYSQDKTQSEIADALGLSRVKVYRLLKEAREKNVVRIFIDWPIQRAPELEKQMGEVFHLKTALILEPGRLDETTALQRLGRLAALYLENILEDGMTLSVCVGRSTYEVIHAIETKPDIHVNVAQAMGSTPFVANFMDSGTLARELSQKLGGDVYYLSSPLLANNPEEAFVLRKQKLIARTLDASRSSHILLVGIGSFENPALSRFVTSGLLSTEELQAIVDDGAIGDIGGQFFTVAGSCYSNSFSERMIGLTLQEMKQIPNTIAVAMGESKAKAILGGLRTGIVDVLCTDSCTAREVLKLNDRSPA